MQLTKTIGMFALVLAAFTTEIFADSFYSVQRPYQAPMPFNPFPNLTPIYIGTNSWEIPDQNVDYNWLMQASTAAEADADASIELSPSAVARPRGGGGFTPLFFFPSGTLALEWTNIDLTNLVASLLIHGATSNGNLQLLSTTNLALLTNQQALSLGEIVTNSGGDDPMIVTNISISNPGTNFIFVHGTNCILTIKTNGMAFAPTNSALEGALAANFVITRIGDISTFTDDLIVGYTISGSASNGVDYATISNSARIFAFNTFQTVRINPLFNTNFDFSRFVSLKLAQSANYLIDTNQGPLATLLIDGNNNGNEWLETVTNLSDGIGAAYDAVSNRVILSVNFDTDGSPVNFNSVDTNGLLAPWSGVSGLAHEIKLACVPTNFPNTNFTPGDLFFGTDTAGRISRLAADTHSSNLNWLTLTGETHELRGSLCFDTNGTFGYDLLVVTGDTGEVSGGGVWRVHSQTSFTLLTNLNCHLEGVTTIPNDPKYGPWAGKLIGGADSGPAGGGAPCLFAIDTNGVTMKFDLGLAPEDIHLVPTNQDFYVNGEVALLKLPRNLLTNHVGDILITQSGGITAPPPLFSLVRWNTNSQQFDQTIILPTASATGDLEHGTFAPMNIPATLHPRP